MESKMPFEAESKIATLDPFSKTKTKLKEAPHSPFIQEVRASMFDGRLTLNPELTASIESYVRQMLRDYD